jgi:predicted GH43/DUF377 family glycosyl hydrolase
LNRIASVIITRCESNPIISPHMIQPSIPGWEVIGVFNAGVVRHEEEIIMLLRVAERPMQDDPELVKCPVCRADGEIDATGEPFEVITLNRQDPRYDLSDARVVRDRNGNTIYLTSISHLRLARSKDGIHFEIDEHPTIMPQGLLETWGIEDPRITKLEDEYLITYSAVSDKGVGVGLIRTPDFRTFKREGIILPPTNKDVVIFPERIGGKYMMLHRPVPSGIGTPDIWLAESEDLKHWGCHRFVIGVRPGSWESARIGAGCVPIRTKEGWLILYHGADEQHRYGMSAALLSLDDPSRVIARLDEPFMLPEAEYERVGFFPNVVFACGAIIDGDDVHMYYGAADEHIARATFRLSELMSLLLAAR